jgi:spoIIIJ-associated protein
LHLEGWVEDAKQLVKGLLERMGTEAEVEIVQQERDLLVEIKGDREGNLTGKDGRTLEALQTLLSRMINKQYDGLVRVQVDVDDYRKRRAESLTGMAVRSGEIVRTSGEAVELGPYNAQDRRVIHIALEEDPYVTTKSVGEGDIKKIKIIPR